MQVLFVNRICNDPLLILSISTSAAMKNNLPKKLMINYGLKTTPTPLPDKRKDKGISQTTKLRLNRS